MTSGFRGRLSRRICHLKRKAKGKHQESWMSTWQGLLRTRRRAVGVLEGDTVVQRGACSMNAMRRQEDGVPRVGASALGRSPRWSTSSPGNGDRSRCFSSRASPSKPSGPISRCSLPRAPSLCERGDPGGRILFSRRAWRSDTLGGGNGSRRPPAVGPRAGSGIPTMCGPCNPDGWRRRNGG